MINILIVEDNNIRVKKIYDYLFENQTKETRKIDIVSDIKSSKLYLREKKYDLLILDIQIPNTIGELPLINGGFELIKIISGRKKIYNFPNCIFGISSDKTIVKKNEDLEYDNYIQLVFCDNSTDDWLNKIISTIDLLEQSKVKKEVQRYDYDLALICALHETELETVRKLSEVWNKKEIDYDNANYYEFKFKNQEKDLKMIATSLPRMGLSAASMLTTKVIYNFKPKYVVMLGVTAGISGKVNLGDILVANPSWDYGSGKICGDGFKLDLDFIKIAEELESMFQDIKLDENVFESIRSEWDGRCANEKLSLHIGPVASGAAVISDEATINRIKEQQRKIIGIEMETYGVYNASHYSINPKPLFFSLKSVSDFADNTKSDDYRDYAAFTCSKMLLKLINNYLDFDEDYL